MVFHLKQGLEEVENTVCLVCKDDYEDIAEECFIAGVCEDCRDSHDNQEILERVLECN